VSKNAILSFFMAGARRIVHLSGFLGCAEAVCRASCRGIHSNGD
jgi:hypothetical protein